MVDRSSRHFRQTANMTPSIGNTEINGGGCRSNNVNNGCNRGNSSNGMESTACKALHRRLQALDFSIIDTVLYLNAYPDSKEALAYYQKLIAERDSLKMGLAQTCRTPVTSFDNASADSWDWIKGPWPWEASAN